MRKANVYVASSWRNMRQPALVAALRVAGFEVYDFKNPIPGDSGFQWREVDPTWKDWSVEEYKRGLEHPVAQDGFGKDMRALKACDVCVLILPCGRSAHLELGWACGAGKLTLVVMEGPLEPELMYLMNDGIHSSIESALGQLLMLFPDGVMAGEAVPA